MAPLSASITKHTTRSKPHPHVVYIVDITDEDGSKSDVGKRYSEFVDLHKTLGDDLTLPPKHSFEVVFVPGAWIDYKLIRERKDGLTAYLAALLSKNEWRLNTDLLKFLTTTDIDVGIGFDMQDALPSTISKTAGLEVAQAVAESEVAGEET